LAVGEGDGREGGVFLGGIWLHDREGLRLANIGDKYNAVSASELAAAK
jgi:hypothetical protein